MHKLCLCISGCLLVVCICMFLSSHGSSHYTNLILSLINMVVDTNASIMSIHMWMSVGCVYMYVSEFT